MNKINNCIPNENCIKKKKESLTTYNLTLKIIEKSNLFHCNIKKKVSLIENTKQCIFKYI